MEASDLEPWVIVIFAHNEEQHVLQCLQGLDLASNGHAFEAVVLVNGSSDATEDIVREFAKTDTRVTPISITVADKCNAWNHYVHEMRRDAEIHFFMDGDVVACETAFVQMAKALDRHRDANAVSAVPATGRSKETQVRNITADHDLVGNLYALRGCLVERIRRRNVRLPIGIVGDDSLVGALVKWDLDPQQPWQDARVVACTSAGFTFKPVSLL